MTEGLGPEVAAAHIAVTASFKGMAAQIQREARMSGQTLGRTLTASASTGARSAGSRAGSEFGGAFSEKASIALKNVFVYGGAYGAIRGLETGFKAVAGQVIGFNSQLEQSEVAFTGLLGSNAAAKREMAWIKDFAKTTPFQFGDLLTSDQQLIAMGASAADAHKQITAIGDAAAGLGRGKESIDRMVIALGQMQSKGRIQSEELMQLQEAGIPALAMLAKAFGTTTDEMQSMITKGQVKSAEAVPALVAAIEGRFAGQMANQSKTFKGAISNIEDTLQQSLAQNGKEAFDTVNKAAHDFLTYLNSPAGQQAVADIGHGFAVATDTATHLGKALWSVREPLVALGAGYIAIKAGQAVLVKGAGVVGGFRNTLSGAGTQATISARMQDAYNSSLQRTVIDARAAAVAVEGLSIAQSGQLGGLDRRSAAKLKAAQAAAGTSGSTPFVVNQAGTAASEASLRRFSLSAAGAGRAMASATPLIGAGTIAITSLTGAADTGAGQVANFAASGAMLGSIAGPWGAAAGAIAGGFIGIAKGASDAKAAINDMATATSRAQLMADLDSGKGSWLTGGLADDLKKSGSSLSEFKEKLAAGGATWDAYSAKVSSFMHVTGSLQAGTLTMTEGFESVRHATEKASLGLISVKAAVDAERVSAFAASSASYKSAGEFIRAARAAHLNASEVTILAQAARGVPKGSTITFQTNAIAIMKQIEALKQVSGHMDTPAGDRSAAANQIAADQKKLTKMLNSLSTTSTISAPSIPSGGGGKSGPSAADKARAKALDALKKAASDAAHALDDTKSASQSFADGIKQGLTKDIWGSSGKGVFDKAWADGSIGAANQALKQQIADSKEFAALEKSLKGRLGNTAAFQSLVASGDINRLRMANAASDADLAAFVSNLAAASKSTSDAANAGAAAAGYAAKIDKQTKVLEDIRNAVKAQTHSQKVLVNKNANAIAAATGKTLNKTAKKARRS